MTEPAEQPQDFGDSVSEPETIPIFEVVALLDQSRQNYLTTCARYAERPNLEQEELIRRAVLDHCEAFRVVLWTLEPATPLADLITESAQLLKIEDHERANTMNRLLRKKDVIKKIDLNLDSILEYANRVYDEDKLKQIRLLTISQTLQMFNQGISLDTAQFVTEMQKTNAARRIRFQHKLGEHAVDVIKMTLSVAAAIVIARKFDRPKTK